MNARLHLVEAALLGAALVSQAAGGAAGAVYKCVAADGRTAYQGDPCAAGVTETQLNIAAATQDAAARPPPAPPISVQSPSTNAPTSLEASPRGPLPWGGRTLAAGMSDDEVLNLPGWGRPSRVTRARMPHAWHEDWTYLAPGASEERRLHFVNARLVSMEVEPAGEPWIQMTTR